MDDVWVVYRWNGEPGNYDARGPMTVEAARKVVAENAHNKMEIGESVTIQKMEGK